jgi:hypothetical protein
MSSFQRAQKTQARLRLALIGPAGAGKTYTALELAKHLGGKVAVVDTEHGSAAKYADLYEFDTVALTDFSPEGYISLLREAEQAGYDVVVLDSLTHEWKWCLEEVDNVKARTKNPNSFAAWKDITPRHNSLTEAILQSSCHVIGTMRMKMEYVLEEDEKGRKVPRKVGMAPVQRDGVEYEFDLIGDLDLDNTLVVSKTRCPALAGKVIRKPGAELAAVLKEWLGTGIAAPAVTPTAVPPKAAVPSDPEKQEGAGNGAAAATFEQPDELAKERRRMWALFKKVVAKGEVTEDELKAEILATYGVTSTKDIPLKELQALNASLQLRCLDEVPA